jgi:hypothetical protein
MTNAHSVTAGVGSGITVFREALGQRQEERLTKARQEATTQGSQGLPLNDQEQPPPYQMQLHAECRQDIALLQERFGKTVQTSYSEISDLEKKLASSSETWENQLNELLRVMGEEISDKENAAKQAHEGKKNLLVEILQNQIAAPYNQVLNKLNVLKNKLGRGSLDTWLDSPVWYFIFLALIGLSEYPLNSIVFADLLLSLYETLLLSGTLVISIPLAAHFAGVSWKRRAENKHNVWIATVCTAAVTALSWYIGVQRVLFIEGRGLEVTAESATASRWILFGLSLLLYGLATLLSYGHHDRSSELQIVTGEHKKAKEKYDEEYPPKQAELNQLVEAHEVHLAGLSAESVARQGEIRERRQKLEEQLTRLRGSYDATLMQLQAVEEFIEGMYLEAVHLYQSENVSARPNHRVPISFNVTPPGFNGYFANLIELDPNPTKAKGPVL